MMMEKQSRKYQKLLLFKHTGEADFFVLFGLVFMQHGQEKMALIYLGH